MEATVRADATDDWSDKCTAVYKELVIIALFATGSMFCSFKFFRKQSLEEQKNIYVRL